MEMRDAKRCRIAAAQMITEVLPVEVLRHVFGQFLGPVLYRYVAGTCCSFRDAYEGAVLDWYSNKTSYESTAVSVSCAELCLCEANSIDQLRHPFCWYYCRRRHR